MAGPPVCSHASRYRLLLHISQFCRTFLCPHQLLNPSHALSSAKSLSNIFLPASHPTTPSDSDPRPGPNLLATTLLLLVPHPSPATKANIIYATRQANLVLVGAIIIGSIRRVLHGAARALRATPATRNRVASLVLLVLAQLMVRRARILSAPREKATADDEVPNRAYIFSRRSFSCARRSRLLRIALAPGCSRRCRLTILLALCSIGASS